MPRYLGFDFETVPRDGAADLLIQPADPPANYKDPEKIAAWQAERMAQDRERLALDIDGARIVCVAWTTGGAASTEVCPDEATERQVLRAFIAQPAFTDHSHQLVTFNGCAYDAPLLIRRCQYLGLPAPWIETNKYRSGRHLDLMQALTFFGTVRARSLQTYARLFGLPVTDETTGADVARLVAAGDWDAVRAHAASDVELLQALAVRTGYLAGTVGTVGTV